MRITVLGGLAMLACVWWACSATRPSEREDRLRCGTIELFPPALSPARPYRVLGPISAEDRTSDQALREAACRAGADAVIDFRREAGNNSSASSIGSGGPAFEASVTLTGTAVVYTDRDDAGAAPTP